LCFGEDDQEEYGARRTVLEEACVIPAQAAESEGMVEGSQEVTDE
jgi:hypothetical protein